MTLPKTIIRNSSTGRNFSFGLFVVACFLHFSNTPIMGQNQFSSQTQLIEPANGQTGFTSQSTETGTGFSQMPLSQISRQVNGSENRSSGRTTAVIQETSGTPNQQRNRETPNPLTKIELKTRPLSSNIVEASRRVINDATQYSSTSAQNTSAQKQNSGSGWSLDGNQRSSFQSYVKQTATTQNSTGQVPTGQNSANRTVAYSQNQPSVSSPIRMASMSTDLERSGNSIRGNAAQMGASDLLNVNRGLIGDEDLVSGSAATSQENEQANGTILPTETSKAEKTEPREKLNLTDTIKKVAISTIVILVLCVAAMVILKKTGYTGPVNKKKAEPEFDVIETKKISGKCQLQLVTIRNHKVIVGIDQSGIKSMVCLPPSFADEYDEAKAMETALDDAAAETNVNSNNLTDSSSIADLLATNAEDLYESAKKRAPNGAAAMPASLTGDSQQRESHLAARSKTTTESESPLENPTRPKRRRPPIRRFHSYEIAGGGNSGE